MIDSPIPLVSIITPVFNSATFIGSTIKSVLSQTFKNWEWIFVDGGSKDNSADIIRELAEKDPRVHYVFNTDDKGPAHARYTGIMQSRSKYVAFLDADDIWLKDKLEFQLLAMESEHLPFTYTLCRELQPDNKFVSPLLPTSQSFTYRQYLRKRGIYAFTVIVERKLLTQDIISLWYKDAYEDTLWWILIMKKGITAKLIPYDLGLYRLSANQLSSRRTHTIKRVYSIYDHFKEINFFEKNIYFISYLFNSGMRHLFLKVSPKKPITSGIL